MFFWGLYLGKQQCICQFFTQLSYGEDLLCISLIPAQQTNI